MSKLTQIERALLGIDQASFQRLCDSYLHCKGYEGINPLGLVIGADKVARGTPDTFFTQRDGRFIFAQHTTQQTGLAGKFQDDLEKCFDEEKTGVPVELISEILLCHNSVIEAEEQLSLQQFCGRRNVRLTMFGMGPLKHDLYDKYPGLARDFLGVEVDTGQIVTPEEFVAFSGKRAFATPLGTTFRFRESEVATVLSALERDDLALVVGHAGVGKTRLALECCCRYAAEHPGLQVRCIYDRGVNLYEDLRVHFSPPGQYLLMVDDANRVNGFQYAVQLLNYQTEERKIKIIATVRDYALEAAREISRESGGAEAVDLKPLKDEQIQELVCDEYKIRNSHYLQRIADIAKGNPRLALMAACVAVREDTLESIADVTTLYDEYFRSITADLQDLRDKTLLQVAGLISFLRVVDRSSSELMGAITDAFGLAPDTFWESAERLHDMEVVDMYENEVVRISDQVLSTYLFYLSVFKEKALDFGLILEHFFPRFRQRMVDVLNPVLDTFNTQEITHEIQPRVERVWRLLDPIRASATLPMTISRCLTFTECPQTRR